MIIVRLENVESKREIMRNKFKLKGEKIFIENDLSWEERKIQERINRWVRRQREKGLDVKVGLGRVRVKGIWRAWTEIEREEEERTDKGKEGDAEVMERGEGNRGGEENGILGEPRSGQGGKRRRGGRKGQNKERKGKRTEI